MRVEVDQEMMRRRELGDPTLPVNGELNFWIAGQFPREYRGHGIDVGASDGRFVNSTILLEEKFRWMIVSVDANPHYKPLLLKNRAFVSICAVGKEPQDEADFHMNLDNLEAFSALNPVRQHPRFKEEAGTRWGTIKVRVKTLDQLLKEWEFPKLDLLCVDVEGGERDVLAGMDWSLWKPKVVVVESWEEGELDDALPGYERAWRTAANDCYIRKETS